MIEPITWRIACDHPAGCQRSEKYTSYSGLLALQRQGWQVGVKLDGSRARRGGKDYCPRHTRGGSDA
jgi:hypothetical protein